MEFSNNMFAIIAMVMAMGLVGVVAIDILREIQNAEAKGCPNSIAVNASKGRCFNHGPN
jgi:multidrug efflux pump subunit AcrB